MTDHRTLPGHVPGEVPRPGTGGAVTPPGSGDDELETRLHPEDGSGSPPPGGTPPADAGDDESSAPGEEDEEASRRSFWKELPVLIAIALVVAVLIKTFLVQAFWIPSGSMEETLQVNDRVLVNKLAYRIGDVARGDVVVFDDPTGAVNDESIPAAVWRNLLESVGLSTPRSEYIKRVIGLPGEEIRVRGGRIEVDGAPLDEPWVHHQTQMSDFGPEEVGEDELFVMGDNRNASRDSRVFGPIERDSVVGKAFVVLWPPSRWSGL